MSEVPVGFAAMRGLVSPLPDAVVPPIERVSELIHLVDGRQPPHPDDPLASSSEQDPLKFGIRILSAVAHCEKGPRMASQGDIRL